MNSVSEDAQYAYSCTLSAVHGLHSLHLAGSLRQCPSKWSHSFVVQGFEIQFPVLKDKNLLVNLVREILSQVDSKQ